MSGDTSTILHSALVAAHSKYRGRIAPSPTGYLHLGHGRTFWIAYQRALERNGILVLRNEDLDPERSKPEFVSAMIEDLRWLGIHWQEGPDMGGPFAPYEQSERRPSYVAALRTLADKELIYPCTCSRREIERVAQAPNQGDEESPYPGTCRTRGVADARSRLDEILASPSRRKRSSGEPPRPPNWRFRVPQGESVSFADGRFGSQRFVGGQDFGDFIVWRHDDVPSYQLAVVVDDAAMKITEVVRGADLLLSTARQLLLYAALGWRPPDFYHCPLVTDESGVRLAKRHDSMSLRALRNRGATPLEIHGR